MMKQKYDIAVIGAGPGGYVAALHAAKHGFKTICIDKRHSPGGTCLHVGCIPSKALLYSTEFYSQLRTHGKTHGITMQDLAFDFAQLMRHKSEVVAGIVKGVEGLFQKPLATFLSGEARFTSSHSICVASNGKEQEIEADYFILATGSEPIPFPPLPFDEKRVLSSTGTLELSEVPSSLLVLGGGVIGVELASVYNRLGCKVSIVEMLDKICPAMDESISPALMRILKNQGIDFHLSTTLMEVKFKKGNKGVSAKLKKKDEVFEWEGEAMLIAIGRRPYTAKLDLDKAGVTLSAKGFVAVDGYFRSSEPHIFAIGDLIEGVMLAHRASEEGVAVVDWIRGQPHPVNYLTIPNVIYTSPEVAAVGLTQQEAHAAGLTFVTATAPFKANGRARCMSQTDGFVKVIAEAQTQRLIGMHILGSAASELIAEGMIAMEKKATLMDLACAPHAHPTLSETIKEAAAVALEKQSCG